MKQLRLLWLPLLLWHGGLCTDDGDAKPDGEKEQRRLGELRRHLRIVAHAPELLDEQGVTPILQLGALKLRHVFTVNRAMPGLLGHAEFSEDYYERRRRLDSESAGMDGERAFHPGSRRLSGIQTELLSKAAATPYKFTTPRDRVRLFAVLNGAALPEAAYTNASRNYWGASGQVHEDPGHMAFTPNRTGVKNASLVGNGSSPLHTGGWTKKTMGNNFTRSIDVIGNAYRDGQALRGARASVRTAAAKQTPGWSKDIYKGLRAEGCSKKTEKDPRCWEDPGVALSVYEEGKYKVIVFHSDWSTNWYEYIVWQNRAWIIDDMENQVKNQWTIDGRQAVTKTMIERKGEGGDALQELCSFKDELNKPIEDAKAYSKIFDLPEQVLEKHGYWEIIKKIVRVVLPEARDRVKERGKTLYLTGSGFGGIWAALSSMWLKKMDDATYQTFTIAGGGFQCIARQLTQDMNPWEAHEQINVYAHVMDIYARLDFVSGKQCLYGLWNMTPGGDVHTFCSGIVGFTGPQLIYRGKLAASGAYQDKKIQKAVKEGRKAFDACHYYTHSTWYAAILFLSDTVLMADGTTDGGCKLQAGIPQTDKLGKCPAAARVDADCAAIISTKQDFPWMACIFVAGGLMGFIFCFAFTGYMCLQRVRNDMWVFGHDNVAAQKQGKGCWSTCLGLFGIDANLKDKKTKVKGDRAKLARERAKQTRLNKVERAKDKDKKKKEEAGAVGASSGEEAWQALKGRLEAAPETLGKTDEMAQAAGVVGFAQSAVVTRPVQEVMEDDIVEELKPLREEEAAPQLDTFKKGDDEGAGKSSRSKDRSRRRDEEPKDSDRSRRRDGDRDKDKDRDRRRPKKSPSEDGKKDEAPSSSSSAKKSTNSEAVPESGSKSSRSRRDRESESRDRAPKAAARRRSKSTDEMPRVAEDRGGARASSNPPS